MSSCTFLEPAFVSLSNLDEGDEIIHIAEAIDEASDSSGNSISIIIRIWEIFQNAKLKLFTQGEVNDLVR